MAYLIVSGEIQAGVRYFVAGSQSIIYNGNTYGSGQYFQGVSGVFTFTYLGSGTQLIYEVSELVGAAVVYSIDSVDDPVYPDTLSLNAMSLEMELTEGEKIINETTAIRGFAVELIDYPFYCFDVIEVRL